MTDPLKCPTCESPSPRMHPATQAEGEVIALCPDPFHATSGCPNCPPSYDCESGNYYTGGEVSR